MSQLVRVEKAGNGVAWVILDNPERRNALSTEMNRQLVEALQGLRSDPEVSCLVLRGAGEKAFCAGGDLREVAGKRAQEFREEFGWIVAALEAIAAARQPVIAAVQGYALGGGCGLVAACDLAIASEDAVFGTPELRIGRFPLLIAPPILRCLGRKKALEMFYTARRFSAAEALEMGLVNRVVPGERLWAEAQELAAEIASMSPLVVGMGKEAIGAISGMEYGASLRYLREMLAMVVLTEDSAEGVRAFLEKRAPRWTSR